MSLNVVVDGKILQFLSCQRLNKLLKKEAFGILQKSYYLHIKGQYMSSFRKIFANDNH